MLGGGLNNILALCLGCTKENDGYFSVFQDGGNVIHVGALEQVTQTIYLEKSLSDEREIFYENVFNDVRRLTCQTQWLLFLFQYERVSNPCLAIE